MDHDSLHGFFKMNLENYLKNTNVQAFLRVIREGETNQTENAYRTIVGGNLFDSFDQHPNVLVYLPKLDLSSTAAGAYQFLNRTWKGLVDKYKFKDFKPHTQDLGAIGLIIGRGALDDVIEGRFEQALKKCNKEWASLPGSPYGQGTISLERAKAVYEAYGGSYNASRSPVEPLERPLKESKGVSMDPFIGIAVGLLKEFLPKVKDFFGSGSEVSERNFKAAELMVDVAKSAIGAKNEQELVSAIKTDAVARSQVEQAIQGKWFEITEVGGGINSAHSRSLEMTKASVPFWKQPAFAVTALLLPLVYATVGSVLWMDKWTQEVQLMVVTAVVSGLLTGITGFWLGTSWSSFRKDEEVRGQVSRS